MLPSFCVPVDCECCFPFCVPVDCDSLLLLFSRSSTPAYTAFQPPSCCSCLPDPTAVFRLRAAIHLRMTHSLRMQGSVGYLLDCMHDRELWDLVIYSSSHLCISCLSSPSQLWPPSFSSIFLLLLLLLLSVLSTKHHHLLSSILFTLLFLLKLW